MVLGGGVLTKATILFATSQIGRINPQTYCEYNEPGMCYIQSYIITGILFFF